MLFNFYKFLNFLFFYLQIKFKNKKMRSSNNILRSNSKTQIICVFQNLTFFLFDVFFSTKFPLSSNFSEKLYL